MAFAYENFTYLRINSKKYTLSDINTSTSQYDLLLTIYTLNNGFKFQFEFDTNLFKTYTVIEFIYSLGDIIHQIVENPEIKINSIQMFGKQNNSIITKDGKLY